MSIARFLSFVCGGTLFVCGSVHAALLNLSKQDGAPDLFASFISVNYIAIDKTFTATGFSDTYYPTWGNGSPGTPLGAGTWKLTATLGANNSIVGGHLDVYNTYNVDSPSGSPDLLLSGNLVTGNAGQANYAASKAGLIGMSKSLAAEIASRNVTVNCVAPGFITTAMTDALTEEQKQRLLPNIPVGYIGEPKDVSGAVVFLASEEARYITGQTIHVNGGMVMV